MVKRLLSALRLNEFHLADPGFRRDVGSEVATLVAGGGELEESPGGSPDLSHSYVELAEGSCEAKEAIKPIIVITPINSWLGHNLL